MNICIVSEGYPYEEDSQFSFVEQLCIEMSKQGVMVTVISPQSLLHVLLLKDKKHPLHRTYKNGGLPIDVYRPFALLAPYRFWRYNDYCFKKSVSRLFRKLNKKIDVCYGHFWNNAYYISNEAIKNNIPLFVASGEGNFDDLEKKYKSKNYQEFSKQVKGVICVSSSCRDISISYGLANDSICKVFPNAIDNSIFYKKEKNSLRRIYGFNDSDFIVAFVGGFINRKGSNRLSDAILKLEQEGVFVKSFFIGKGQGPENLVPTCNGVLHCGPMEHSKISDYLNMADIFVLPTLNEGCCNAIIEAMACGLPIVSSDRPFNHDILNSSNSILIDPNNIDQIKDTIKELYYDRIMLKKLSEGALNSAHQLTISQRCTSILNFINEKITD